jgi:hypothetical protein
MASAGGRFHSTKRSGTRFFQRRGESLQKARSRYR